jgi:glycosyltransferase involved in cell wall biosynthesis
VPNPVRIVQVNAAYDGSVSTAGGLLDRYTTLTDWSAALSRAGAHVTTLQRFRENARLERDGVRYEFISDRHAPWLSTREAPAAFAQAVAGHGADVIHVNGLIFPQLVGAIRQLTGRGPAIVVQHHGGEFPVRGSGPIGFWRRRRWREGLSAADAVSFTSADQAAPWREAGVLTHQRVLEIVEASTNLRGVPRERARAAVGIGGDPLILWVGRLTANKDPLTVLSGLEQALPRLPGASVVMVFGGHDLLAEVTARVQSSAVLRGRVTLTGAIPHEEMPNFYSAADIFVSGSHSEGSGYALIEAMAAGVVPVVTDIPSFRVIAGPCGARWQAGDAAAFSTALLEVAGQNATGAREQVKQHFAQRLHWDAIAQQTLAAYGGLTERKQRTA